MNPPNLSVVCVDNGHYGETGYQKSHTSLGVDLEKIAAGSGIKRTLTIEQEGEHRRRRPPHPRGQRQLFRAPARQADRAAQPTNATSTRPPRAPDFGLRICESGR